MEARSEPERRTRWSQHLPTSRAEWQSFVVNLLRELALVFVAGMVYVVVRKLTEGTPDRALVHARELLRIEGALGLRHEQGFQELVLDHPRLRTFANWVYIWGHWPVITVVCIGLYVTHHANYVRMRNAILVSGMIGFVFFAVLPMSPPRLTPFGYVDTVTVWSESYRVLQPPRYTNLYAAMPSLHFGWDLLVGLTLFLSVGNPLLRAFGILMPMAMAFAVVATGNHWILDVIAGMLVVAVGAAISEGVRHERRRRRARGAGASGLRGIHRNTRRDGVPRSVRSRS